MIGERGWASRNTSGDLEGRAGTIGDAAGKALNRKVHGSNPCSGASFKFTPDNDWIIVLMSSLSIASMFVRGSYSRG